jgi:hypothetical protein
MPKLREQKPTPTGMVHRTADLVAAEACLHDRYELSVEDRLPRCWAQHPGAGRSASWRW